MCSSLFTRHLQKNALIATSLTFTVIVLVSPVSESFWKNIELL
jgi:hypothetical protein